MGLWLPRTLRAHRRPEAPAGRTVLAEGRHGSRCLFLNSNCVAVKGLGQRGGRQGKQGPPRTGSGTAHQGQCSAWPNERPPQRAGPRSLGAGRGHWHQAGTTLREPRPQYVLSPAPTPHPSPARLGDATLVPRQLDSINGPLQAQQDHCGQAAVRGQPLSSHQPEGQHLLFSFAMSSSSMFSPGQRKAQGCRSALF